MESNIAITIITTAGSCFIAFLTFYQKMKGSQRRQNDFCIKKQENLEQKTIEIEKNIEILKNEIEYIKKQNFDFINFNKILSFENDLKSSIIDKVNDILFYHDNIDSYIKHLIFQGRDKSIEFAIKIRKYPNDLTKEIITNEMSNIFDYLKIICKNYFPEKILIGDVYYNFNEYLRHFSDIEIESKLLAKRILENHKTEQEYIQMFTNFVENVIKQGIKLYNQYKNKLD